MKINYKTHQLSIVQEFIHQLILAREMKEQIWYEVVESKMLHHHFLISLN